MNTTQANFLIRLVMFGFKIYMYNNFHQSNKESILKEFEFLSDCVSKGKLY